MTWTNDNEAFQRGHVKPQRKGPKTVGGGRDFLTCYDRTCQSTLTRVITDGLPRPGIGYSRCVGLSVGRPER